MTGVDPSRFAPEIAREWRRLPPPELSVTDVERSRARFAEHVRGLPSGSASSGADVGIEERLAPSLVDDHAIRMRVYRPAREASGGALVYLHGGAFAFGDLDVEDRSCRVWAHEAGCVVVSVDYRLAPEHPYPIPLDDCHSALRWVADHAAELGVDPQRIGVGGCSAGGALAAGLALRCRDMAGPALAFQLLLHPVLDAGMSLPSVRALQSEEQLRETERMWAAYLGGPRADAPVHASPASCTELRGLPPTYLAVAELDYLRDDVLAYGQRLLTAGVPVELHVWPGVPHAFELFFPSTSVTRRALREQARAVARLLSTEGVA